MALAISSWVWANHPKLFDDVAVKINPIIKMINSGTQLRVGCELWSSKANERSACLVIYTP
jgi:hypothetical protein